MVYLHINKRKDKTYYYLKISFRKEGKIKTKNILYLGNNPEKISITRIKNKFPYLDISTIKKRLTEINLIENSKIHKFKENKFFDKNQQLRINSVLKHFNENHSGKNFKLFNIRFIANSLLIEGNSAKPQLVKEIYLKKRIFEERYTKLSGLTRRLKEKYNIRNTIRIIDFLKGNKFPLNINLILKIHDSLMENVYQNKGLRDKQIKIYQRPIKTSSPKDIKKNLFLLIKWYNKNKTKINPLILVVLFHHKFEKIHPFNEGNGETGRIIMNYQLSQLNYPPIIIPANKKQEYFNSLNEADKAIKKDLLSTDMQYYKTLMNFMQKCFIKTYWDNFIA